MENPVEVQARTCGTKSPCRSEALRFIDSAKSPSTIDGDLAESIKRSAFDRLGNWCHRFEPELLQDFSRHGASRPCLETFFPCTILSYPGQPPPLIYKGWLVGAKTWHDCSSIPCFQNPARDFETPCSSHFLAAFSQKKKKERQKRKQTTFAYVYTRQVLKHGRTLPRECLGDVSTDSVPAPCDPRVPWLGQRTERLIKRPGRTIQCAWLTLLVRYVLYTARTERSAYRRNVYPPTSKAT